jgi:hypothetical protein
MQEHQNALHTYNAYTHCFQIYLFVVSKKINEIIQIKGDLVHQLEIVSNRFIFICLCALFLCGRVLVHQERKMQ